METKQTMSEDTNTISRRSALKWSIGLAAVDATASALPKPARALLTAAEPGAATPVAAAAPIMVKARARPKTNTREYSAAFFLFPSEYPPT